MEPPIVPLAAEPPTEPPTVPDMTEALARLSRLKLALTADIKRAISMSPPKNTIFFNLFMIFVVFKYWVFDQLPYSAEQTALLLLQNASLGGHISTGGGALPANFGTFLHDWVIGVHCFAAFRTEVTNFSAFVA
jgi:hypothetical protein